MSRAGRPSIKKPTRAVDHAEVVRATERFLGRLYFRLIFRGACLDVVKVNR